MDVIDHNNRDANFDRYEFVCICWLKVDDMYGWKIDDMDVC
jgi:hypothetical protein